MIGDRPIEVEWRKLRADQLRKLAEDDAIVILPVGSIEQHGPHLPTEVDSMLGETIALRTARQIAATVPVVVLPCLWTGLSEHHMSFGGTITLSFNTYFQLIRDICRSILRHGFHRIVLLNGHGGNNNGLRVITDELSIELRAPILQLTYWHAAAEPIKSILERQKELLHACEAETSMMMALRPELVAVDRIALGEVDAAADLSALIGSGLYAWWTVVSISRSGVIGFPTAASKAKGDRLLTAITQELAFKIASASLWTESRNAG